MGITNDVTGASKLKADSFFGGRDTGDSIALKDRVLDEGEKV